MLHCIAFTGMFGFLHMHQPSDVYRYMSSKLMIVLLGPWEKPMVNPFELHLMHACDIS